jgi:ribosomal protein L11 methyltransferase
LNIKVLSRFLLSFLGFSVREEFMNQTWWELHITVPAAAVDLVCHALATLGSSGVRVQERHLDTFEAPDPDADAPEVYPLRAYFAGDCSEQELLARVAEVLAPLQSMFVQGWSQSRLSAAAVDDWAENWKQNFPLFRVGQLVVRPSWEAYTAAPGEVVLTLDPGMAFGTGTHATTRLCLEALVEALRTRPGARVLDVGTGSGILAIAAASLGATRVLACDIDAEACRVALENVRSNGVAERVEVTDAPLEQLSGVFDVVLANILAEENLRLADALVGHLAPSGALILSGILKEKETLVRRGFTPFDLQQPQVDYLEEWVCLTYCRAP